MDRKFMLVFGVLALCILGLFIIICILALG